MSRIKEGNLEVVSVPATKGAGATVTVSFAYSRFDPWVVSYLLNEIPELCSDKQLEGSMAACALFHLVAASLQSDPFKMVANKIMGVNYGMRGNHWTLSCNLSAHNATACRKICNIICKALKPLKLGSMFEHFSKEFPKGYVSKDNFAAAMKELAAGVKRGVSIMICGRVAKMTAEHLSSIAEPALNKLKGGDEQSTSGGAEGSADGSSEDELGTEEISEYLKSGGAGTRGTKKKNITEDGLCDPEESYELIKCADALGAAVLKQYIDSTVKISSTILGSGVAVPVHLGKKVKENRVESFMKAIGRSDQPGADMFYSLSLQGLISATEGTSGRHKGLKPEAILKKSL